MNKFVSKQLLLETYIIVLLAVILTVLFIALTPFPKYENFLDTHLSIHESRSVLLIENYGNGPINHDDELDRLLSQYVTDYRFMPLILTQSDKWILFSPEISFLFCPEIGNISLKDWLDMDNSLTDWNIIYPVKGSRL